MENSIDDKPQSKDEAYILRDRGQLDKMLDGCRIIGGQKTTEQMKKVWDDQ